jgi:hypothetical protein
MFGLYRQHHGTDSVSWRPIFVAPDPLTSSHSLSVFYISCSSYRFSFSVYVLYLLLLLQVLILCLCSISPDPLTSSLSKCLSCVVTVYFYKMEKFHARKSAI